MTGAPPRRGSGLPDVPDFGGAHAGHNNARITEILRWARDGRQSWLLAFFERRLAGSHAHDPQSELIAALSEAQLAASHEGLVLCCAAGRILYLNDAAKQILTTRRWLVEHEERLAGTTVAIDALLRRAMAAAFATSGSGVSTRLRIDAPANGEALLLRIAPLRLPDWNSAATPFVTVHLLRDDDAPLLDEANLIDWYRLSQAEARLAVAFATGISLADYAAAQGVTINTVRTLFARLKSKLDAVDQAAVVRKVLRVAMPQ
jgi:DNA-binding CsgD family transcriptional regulator